MRWEEGSRLRIMPNGAVCREVNGASKSDQSLLLVPLFSSSLSRWPKVMGLRGAEFEEAVPKEGAEVGSLSSSMTGMTSMKKVAMVAL